MLKILKNLTIKEIFLILVVIGLTCVQTFLDLDLPDYMSEITMLVQTPGSEMSEIYLAGFKMLGCALGSVTLAICVAVIAAKIASNFSFIVRGKVFKKVMGFSLNEMNTFSTSSLINRTTNDITQVQMLIVMGLQMLIKAPMTAAWAIIKISGKNDSWTIVTAIAVAILLAFVTICFTLAIPKFKRLQILTDNINRVSREHLEGLSVVRAYNAEEYQGKKFEKANTELSKTHIFTGRVTSFFMPTIQIISSGLVLAVYLVGAVLINEAVGETKLTLFSDMVVFSAYAMQVIMSFMMLVIVFIMLPSASVSAKRINEVLKTKSSIINGTIKTNEQMTKGEVVFKDVSFKYPEGDEYVLKDINLVAKKGETVAFIGSTGSGKSTIINLIPRFYDVTEGEILVNGVNVKEYDQNYLNKIIGYVSQKATIFSGTIESNVLLGDNEQGKNESKLLEDVIATAQAKDFVENMENQYQARTAQGGGNLSGGQKQRISIARAIFRKPQILIFDDSFSALDYKTDKMLRHALGKEFNDTTRFIVGQRIGTIRDADKIVVLEDGQIVGIGKHGELLATCETYKQIALSQLSEEELQNE